MGHPWSADDLAQLEALVGDVPFSLVVRRFNRWAADNGRPARSEKAIASRCKRSGLPLRCHGDWLSLRGVAEILGCSRARVRAWVHRGWLRAHRITYVYVSRLDLRRLARFRPHLFAGIDRWRLFQLLEDEAMAETIARLYPRSGRAPKPTRCVETGRVWPTIQAAAKAVHVHRRAITIAVQCGGTCAGYHWELLK
jgi:hypothetical protein